MVGVLCVSGGGAPRAARHALQDPTGQSPLTNQHLICTYRIIHKVTCQCTTTTRFAGDWPLCPCVHTGGAAVPRGRQGCPEDAPHPLTATLGTCIITTSI